jgi:hypothetical protein
MMAGMNLTKIYCKHFFFVVLEFELKAYTLSHLTSPFFSFEIVSLKLFAWLGFEL